MLPHPYYVVVLSLQLLQEVEGTVAEFLFSAMPAVGEEDGDHGVDDEQIEREGGDVLLVLHTRAAEGVMGFPILRDAGRKHLLRLLHRGGLQQLAEAGTAVVIKVGKLRDADMREVLRAKSQESPQLVIHRLHRELMREIEIFIPQSCEIAIVQGVLLIALGDGVEFQQSRLPHEDGFYLEEVVPVMVHGSERQVQRPLLEGFAIDSEAEIACQGHEIGVLPVTVALADALFYRLSLLREPFGLQGAHP